MLFKSPGRASQADNFSPRARWEGVCAQAKIRLLEGIGVQLCNYLNSLGVSVKSNHRVFFKSRLSRQTFWILLLGILLIGCAAISVFGTYLVYGRNKIDKIWVANEIVRDVHIAKVLPASELLPHTIRQLNWPGVHVSMNPHPLPHSHIIQTPNAKWIRRYVHQHPFDLKMSMQLPNGQWLNIHAHRFEHKWFLAGMIVSLAALLVGLILLCLWAVKRLGIPMRSFTEAAKRFGVDVQAPPMALDGPPEMQEVIQAFNEMQNRIRRLLHDRTQMLAAISHDLRTPITRLQLRVEYLKDTNQYEKAVADLQEMEHMISSILSFARDYVRSENMERFDLSALLESVCDELVDVGHSVEYSSEMNRLPYFGRIGALKRAFSNLIENGIKYGDKVSVSLKQNGKDIQIKIVDEGPGIPEDQFEKVFAPFYRVDPSRSPKKSGTGLGLAVARDIIRAHGGEITLFNRDPRGLIVLVSLPLQNDDKSVS